MFDGARKSALIFSSRLYDRVLTKLKPLKWKEKIKRRWLKRAQQKLELRCTWGLASLLETFLPIFLEKLGPLFPLGAASNSWLGGNLDNNNCSSSSSPSNVVVFFVRSNQLILDPWLACLRNRKLSGKSLLLKKVFFSSWFSRRITKPEPEVLLTNNNKFLCFLVSLNVFSLFSFHNFHWFQIWTF